MGLVPTWEEYYQQQADWQAGRQHSSVCIQDPRRSRKTAEHDEYPTKYCPTSPLMRLDLGVAALPVRVTVKLLCLLFRKRYWG